MFEWHLIGKDMGANHHFCVWWKDKIHMPFSLLQEHFKARNLMPASTPLFLNRGLRHKEGYYWASLMQVFPAETDNPPYLKEM